MRVNAFHGVPLEVVVHQSESRLYRALNGQKVGNHGAILYVALGGIGNFQNLDVKAQRLAGKRVVGIQKRFPVGNVRNAVRALGGLCPLDGFKLKSHAHVRGVG